jgi:hypothetical protein
MEAFMERTKHLLKYILYFIGAHRPAISKVAPAALARHSFLYVVMELGSHTGTSAVHNARHVPTRIGPELAAFALHAVGYVSFVAKSHTGLVKNSVMPLMRALHAFVYSFKLIPHTGFFSSVQPLPKQFPFSYDKYPAHLARHGLLNVVPLAQTGAIRGPQTQGTDGRVDSATEMSATANTAN